MVINYTVLVCGRVESVKAFTRINYKFSFKFLMQCMDRSDVHNKTCNWQYKQNELDSRDTTHLTLFLQRYYFGNSNWELECFVIKLREFSSEEMIGH